MEYLHEYNATRGDEYSKYHGYAYDGIWVIAKAIDAIIEMNPLKEFAIEDFRREGIQKSLNDTDFIGVTVSVKTYLFILMVLSALKVLFAHKLVGINLFFVESERS